MIALLCPDEQQAEDLVGIKGVFDKDTFMTFIANPDATQSAFGAAGY